MRLRSIDCLRGIAALSVAFGHALIAAPYDTIGGEWFTRLCVAVKWLSATGVPLFFVISGFCIHLSQTRHDGTRRFDFAAFWRRRLWRLYPTYFVVLCGSIGLLLLMVAMGQGAEAVNRYPEPRAQSIALDGLIHAVMLHGLHPFYDQAGGNPPFWTLAREEYLYAMYPLLLVMHRRWRWHTVSLVLAGATIGLGLIAPRMFTAPEWVELVITSAPALWIQWQLGAVAADAYRGAVQLPRILSNAWLVPAWLLVAAVAPFSAVWVGLAYFTLVNAAVQREAGGHWSGARLVSALTALGLWSYSLYLIHHPVQTIALALSRLLWTPTTPGAFVVRAGLLTLASLVAARLLFLAVEQRFLSAPSRDPSVLQPLATARTSSARHG